MLIVFYGVLTVRLRSVDTDAVTEIKRLVGASKHVLSLLDEAIEIVMLNTVNQ